MNIIIDGRTFVALSTGITTFLNGSLSHWAKNCPTDSFIVALPRDLDKTIDKSIFPENVGFVVFSNWFFKKLPNLIWLVVFMPILARKYKADFYFSPVPCIPYFLPKQVKTLITVHDVVNLEFPETMQWTNIIANQLFFNRTIKKANYIWTNSNYTKEKVEQYFPIRKCKSIFTGDAANREIYQNLNLEPKEVESIKRELDIKDRFILFVGSLEPRKNLSFLLSLMPRIYNDLHVQLVVVGGKGWKNSSIKDIINDGNFPQESTIFCGYISNEKLAKLYNMADCFVSASLNEGFGMPQLEALLCGCPVVTSHNSAMIEIASGKSGATTVNGYNPNDWIRAITQTLNIKPIPQKEELIKYDWNIIIQRFFQYIKNH